MLNFIKKAKFKAQEDVRCKCHEHCDATLVILTVLEYEDHEPIYEVQHKYHVLKDPHFVEESRIEAIKGSKRR